MRPDESGHAGGRRVATLAALVALALFAAAGLVAGPAAAAGWELQAVSAPQLAQGATIEALFALDGGNAWEAGSDNSLFFTHDGGQSWAALRTGAPQTTVWHALRFTDLEHGFLAGADGTTGLLYTTANGGRTWEQRLSLPAMPLMELETHGAERAWVSGADGVVYASDDGGASWTQTRTGSDVRLDALSFADADLGLVVGERGAIMRSSDGGATWVRVASPVTRTLDAVAFVSPSLALAVGARGTVLRSTDGGRSWKRIKVPAAHGADCLAVDFETRLHGLIAAAGGRLLETVDGGRTWRAVPHGSVELGAVCDVDFATPPDGTAAALREARRLASRAAAPAWREAGAQDVTRAWTAAPSGTTARFVARRVSVQQNEVYFYVWLVNVPVAGTQPGWIDSAYGATMDFNLQYQNVTGGQPYDGWSCSWNCPYLTITFNAGRSGSAEPAQGFTGFCGSGANMLAPDTIQDQTPSDLNFWFYGTMSLSFTYPTFPVNYDVQSFSTTVALGQGHSPHGDNNWWIGVPGGSETGSALAFGSSGQCCFTLISNSAITSSVPSGDPSDSSCSFVVTQTDLL